MSFDPTGWTSGVSSAAAARDVQMSIAGNPLMGLCAPSECIEPRAAAPPPSLSDPVDVTAPPMRFAPLQRVPARSSSIVVGLASPGRLRPQVFATSRRVSIHREPAGLISCRIRSWGCALQSFVPTAWPYAVSGADPLLALVPARPPSHVPFPLTLAKAEASSSPDGRCLSSGAETPLGRNRRRPSRQSRSSDEPNGRPTLERRSTFEPDSGSTLRAPKRPSSRTVTRPTGTEAPPRRAAPASPEPRLL
jgi:hypothetical protein